MSNCIHVSDRLAFPPCPHNKVFRKEDFSAGKLPDGWMIVDSTKSAKCEWIVTDQPYPGSFQFEQQAPPIASTSRGYHMQFRPGVVTGEEITKWNQREEYPNGYFQTSAIDCAGKNDVVLKFQHLFRWNNWFTGKTCRPLGRRQQRRGELERV